ncbi:hypothetical protein PHLCEN_2v4631 [Hermanssonia centrifuga]|uniref:Phosphoglycerate mutase-like protein n=1 Tax=Hermanssonia centrifuga TaxID=98765 RepID=A0A2R6PMV3_9APHY|nr:hypothetical protein PHLCEN_2v4631 [Hermanssonia centrifuga]
MSANSDSNVIGVVILARHGDRQGRYQNPETYSATSTVITPLGEQQEYQLGGYLRDIYLNPNSSSYIQGIFSTPAIFNESEVIVRADAGGDGGVIVDSSQAMVQGLWPATPLQSIVLANGSSITSPLGGYQYVPSTR